MLTVMEQEKLTIPKHMSSLSGLCVVQLHVMLYNFSTLVWTPLRFLCKYDVWFVFIVICW
jgi:hypothetical protein